VAQSVNGGLQIVLNLLGVLLAFVVVTAGQPATKPNFSGQWKMNVAKSNFGALPPPSVMNRTITHSEPALTIVEEQSSAMGDQKTTRKYVTDGSEITFEVQGMSVASSAEWKDGVLLMVSRVDGAGLTFTDRMTLSPDGQNLTSVVHITSAQGDADITVVFDKQ